MQTVAVAIFAVVTIAATDEKNGHFDMVTASSIWVMNDAGCSAQSGSRCSVSRNSCGFTHFSGIATGSNSLGANVRHWSTILYGNGIEKEGFRTEIRDIIAHMKAQSQESSTDTE